MDEAQQREIASRLVDELAIEGVNAVLVGSSAVVALHLFRRSSKDADALAPPELSLDEARRVMQAIASRFSLPVTETGDRTLSIIKRDEAGIILWRMDLLVSGDGLIPTRAAALIHEHAKQTDIGRAAIPEHVLVMKAIAYGDSTGKGRPERTRDYQSDVETLRNLPQKLDMKLVEELLRAFPDARRDAAVRLINRVFGTGFRESVDPNI